MQLQKLKYEKDVDMVLVSSIKSNIKRLPLQSHTMGIIIVCCREIVVTRQLLRLLTRPQIFFFLISVATRCNQYASIQLNKFTKSLITTSIL